jgi:uncharacterized phosphosugar-binding protein
LRLAHQSAAGSLVEELQTYIKVFSQQNGNGENPIFTVAANEPEGSNFMPVEENVQPAAGLARADGIGIIVVAICAQTNLRRQN